MFLMNLSAVNRLLGDQDGLREPTFHLHYLLVLIFMRSGIKPVRNSRRCSIHDSVTWLPTYFVNWNDVFPSLPVRICRVLEVLRVVCVVVLLVEVAR
jgi:hypothetical protein